MKMDCSKMGGVLFGAIFGGMKMVSLSSLGVIKIVQKMYFCVFG